MYPEISPALMKLAVRGPKTLPMLEPLDAEYFEELSADEAATLLASRFQAFSERGWDWKEALLLTVRPDQRPSRAGSVPHLGDVSAA
jgi:hypothetical protein